MLGVAVRLARERDTRMKFGLFYELQLPRPWTPGSEAKLLAASLDQVELADALGFDHVWAVEHHFLEEYSHMSAPELFLAAASQRSKRIRLGHGIVHMPPSINHPARVAERIAFLDVLSGGRVEFGTGEGASAVELDGFNVAVADKHEMWREATEQAANLLAINPYPGYQGKYVEMPCRSLVPRPLQTPHPPLWVACSSREAIKMAARLGMGALTFSFVNPDEAKQWVADYYETLEKECVPIGHAINPNVAMVAGFGCHESSAEALRRFEDGFRFFFFALGWYYGYGDYRPTLSNIWEEFQNAKPMMPTELRSAVIGDPGEVRRYLRAYEEAGVDQVAFIQQAGQTTHEHIMEALELVGKRVLPEFQDRQGAREREKWQRLQPMIDAAMKRKDLMAPLDPEDIPTFRAKRKPAWLQHT